MKKRKREATYDQDKETACWWSGRGCTISLVRRRAEKGTLLCWIGRREWGTFCVCRHHHFEEVTLRHWFGGA